MKRPSRPRVPPGRFERRVTEVRRRHPLASKQQIIEAVIPTLDAAERRALLEAIEREPGFVDAIRRADADCRRANDTLPEKLGLSPDEVVVTEAPPHVIKELLRLGLEVFEVRPAADAFRPLPHTFELRRKYTRYAFGSLEALLLTGVEPRCVAAEGFAFGDRVAVSAICARLLSLWPTVPFLLIPALHRHPALCAEAPRGVDVVFFQHHTLR